MSLLDRIFNRLKREKNAPSPDAQPENSTLKNLIFDWYNDGGIDVNTFRKEFFEPCIETYRNSSSQKYLFEHAEEQTIDRLFDNHSILYLAAKHPSSEYLGYIIDLLTSKKGPSYSIMDFIRSNYNSRLFANQPPIAQTFELGRGILQSYHAIHSRKNQNISSISNVYQLLAQHKHDEHDKVFFPLFNFVDQQDFKEKPFVYLIAFIGRHWQIKEHLDPDKSPKQAAIVEAFSRAVKVYNSSTTYPLDEQLLIDYSLTALSIPANETFRNTDYKKRKRLGLKNFPKASEFLEKYSHDRETLLQNCIYVLNNNYFFQEMTKFNKDFFSVITSKYAFDQKWLAHMLEYPLQMPKSFIDLIYFPIITEMESEIECRGAVFNNFEQLIYRSLNQYKDPAKESKIMDFLQSKYQTIEDTPDKVFFVDRYNPFYAKTAPKQGSSTLFISDNKSAQLILQQLVELLQPVVSISIKSIEKRIYSYADYSQLGQINVNGQDFKLGSRVVEEINHIFGQLEIGYKIIPVPFITLTENELYISGVMVINAKEFEQFKTHYLKTWYPELAQSEYYSAIEYAIQDAPSIKDLKPTEIAQHLQNPFTTNRSWDWFRERYIEPKDNKEAWYEIMGVFIETKGSKKPNKQWLKTAKKTITNFGEEKFFKELDGIISNSIKEEFWLLEAYRNPLKGIIWSCCVFENEDGFAIVKSIVESAYTKIYGVGPKSAAAGNLGMDALASSGKIGAFGMLNLMRNKSKYSRFVKAIDRYIDKFKETSDLPEEAIADRAIPKFGFHESEKMLKVNEQISAVFRFNNGKLSKKWIVNGKEMSKAPKDLLAAFPNEEKEINAEYKRVNTIFKDLRHRIKTYWLLDRKWSYSDWQEFIFEHPLISPHIQGMIWQNETQNKSFIIQENNIIQSDGGAHTANKDEIISLWHPIIASEEAIQDWQSYLTDHKIQQPFRQVFREHYPFSATEIKMEKSPRFAHHFLLVNKLMAIANAAGWRFTYEHEGQSWPRRYIKVLGVTVHLQCDYNRSDHAIPSKDIFFTKGDTTKIAYTKLSDLEPIPFEEIPLKSLSELCRDVDLFIATSSIANDPELSLSTESYQFYRDDFHRGKFSDNASAKIRKRILTQLIPVLKLDGASFEGNYFVVHGKLNSYRINLGSGFAQIKGSQKHINLLPEIAPMKKNKKIHVPVQDDETLYIILAKALFLQKDDKVTDPKLKAILEGN